MIAVDVLRIARWEWFKLRRRWMPWIMLGILVVLSQFGLLCDYASYHNEGFRELASGGGAVSTTVTVDDETVTVWMTCSDILEERFPPEFAQIPKAEQEKFLEDVSSFRESVCDNISPRDSFRRGFTLPQAITNGIVNWSYPIAAILIIILSASSMGGEYGWGTMRTVLTRGVGRWQFLASKVILLAGIGFGGLVLASVGITAACLLAAVIPPSETGSLADAGRWSDAAVAILKSVYALVPYIAAGTFFAVLTRSSAMSIGLLMGYYVVELIVASTLLTAGPESWVGNIPDFLIGSNANEWMGAALVNVEVSSESVTDAQLASDDSLRAFFVLLGYTAAFGAAAFALFRREDIAGAKGG